MMSALHKSRMLYLIALDRLSDYFDLVRVEMKIREHHIAFRIAGLMIALLFTLLATVFFGLAIIVSFWDSPHRALAAWIVVLLYGGIAGVSFYLCIRHFRSLPIATTLRTQLRQDIDVIKENI